MSRTYKDRPYAVRVFDPKEERVSDHDHRHLGKPIYRRHIIRDDNGKVIYDLLPYYAHADDIIDPFSYVAFSTFTSVDRSRPFTDRYLIRNYFRDVYPVLPLRSKEKLHRLAKEAIGAGNPKAEILLGYSEVARTETVLIGVVPDHCTIDTSNFKDADPLAPCSYYLAIKRGFYNRPMTDEKKQYHGSRRSNELSPLREYAKAYNSGEDISEYEEDSRLHSREHRHTGWWD